MPLSLFRSISKLHPLIHFILAVGSFLGFRWIQTRLDASYAASKHPVDYLTGQTGFDAEKIKGYYAAMSDFGTLDIYWITQIIDFGFILAMLCMGLFVCTFISRLGRYASWSRFCGLLAGVSIALGAISDAIENLWSFVMLADPQGFSNWLAFPYSGFAVLKFALITLGMGLLIATIILAMVGRLLNKPRIG